MAIRLKVRDNIILRYLTKLEIIIIIHYYHQSSKQCYSLD